MSTSKEAFYSIYPVGQGGKVMARPQTEKDIKSDLEDVRSETDSQDYGAGTVAQVSGDAKETVTATAIA